MSEISIVGLNLGDQGRSCDAHQTACGLDLAVDDLVSFMPCKCVVKGKEVDAVKVFRESTGCLVGFVGKDYICKCDWKDDSLAGRVVHLNSGYKLGWGRVVLEKVAVGN